MKYVALSFYMKRNMHVQPILEPVDQPKKQEYHQYI